MQSRAPVWLVGVAMAAGVVVALLLLRQSPPPRPGAAPPPAVDRDREPEPALDAIAAERVPAPRPTFRPLRPVPKTAARTDVPQAAPVALALWAAATEDVECLRSLYSRRMVEQIDRDDDGWPGHAANFACLMQQRCGRYDPRDYTFTFAGDAAAGRVTVRWREQRLADMKVACENGRWLLDEL